MKEIFLTLARFERIRHIKNIEITVPNDERKNIILTGRNGSGKTSLLDALYCILKKMSIDVKTSVLDLTYKTEYFKREKEDYGNFWIDLNGASVPEFFRARQKNFVLVYIRARRALDLKKPESIQRMYDVVKAESDSVSGNFLKFLVQINYQRMVAETQGNIDEKNKLDLFFNRLISALREVYGNDELQLVHDPKELLYYINIPGVTKFSLSQMSDGYSALFEIVFELIMRMVSSGNADLDAPGIVLIDEIETHLHVEMQKAVLPFLCKMFPDIQLIISTHSPFVINSTSNCIVYDMERRITIEDMSAYSYEGIVNSYFKVDSYSNEIKNQFERYLYLITLENPSENEEEELNKIERYLYNVPPGVADDLVYEFRAYQLKRR